jgi:hypothetical protein
MKKILSLLSFFLIIGVAGQLYAASIALNDDGFESGDINTYWNPVNAEVGYDSSYQHFGEYYAQMIGSGSISQYISYNDGDTYSFDWLFLFTDGDPDDYAYYKIGDNGSEQSFYTKGLSSDDPPDNWTTETIVFSGTGTDVYFEIGVVSYGNTPSQLLIDATPVPEPASLLLLGCGILSIAAIYRKLGNPI